MWNSAVYLCIQQAVQVEPGDPGRTDSGDLEAVGGARREYTTLVLSDSHYLIEPHYFWEVGDRTIK